MLTQVAEGDVSELATAQKNGLLTIAVIQDLWQRRRDALSRRAGCESGGRLDRTATENTEQAVLAKLFFRGLPHNEDTSELAKGLVKIALTPDVEERRAMAEALRATYCFAVQKRAVRDGHVGVDIISYAVS